MQGGPCVDTVVVGPSEIGQGVFASRHLNVDDPILILSGPIISYQEAVAREVRRGDPLQIARDRYIDLEPPGVFLNHSCDPNSGIRDHTVLVAIKAIEPGTEIRFDYSTTMAEDDWTMDCECGAQKCRGIIQDFVCLPEELRARYLALGIVQRFIVEIL